MTLTSEQVWFFRHNGFLQLPGRLPPEMVGAVRAAVWRDIRGEIAPVVRDRHGRVVRSSNLWQRGSPFREALTCHEVLGPLAALLGPNIELILNRHNHACLRLVDDGTSYLHRDILQWTRAIVTVIVYLEDTTVENGCTQVVPGTHLLPAHGTPNIETVETVVAGGLLGQAVPLPMPAGGLLALDSLLYHGAGTNRTDGSRMSLTAGYHAVDELCDAPNPKRVLVRGQQIYQGNDR